MASNGGFYNNVATQSLRFDDGSNTYLTRTPSSASNRKTWTWSGWVKRGALGSSYYMPFGVDSGGGTGGALYFYNDFLHFGQGATTYRITNAVFRDVFSWYHVLLTLDTTDATAVDRVKIYINGNQVTSFSTTNNPSVNADLAFNNNVAHAVGADIPNTGARNFFDGYLSDVNFIDGQALTPTSFGEFKNGVWIPIDTSGLTFGTNGFRLQFKETGVGTASSSTIGADTSGNTNHFTSSGIVASDCAMPDSPENNFATLNALNNQANSTLSEGNLKAVLASGASARTPSTFAVSSGKWYWEVRQSSANRFGMGVFDTDKYVMTNEDAGADAHEWAWITDGGDSSTGILFNNSSSSNHGVEVADGEVIMVALDADNDAIWFGKENSWFNTDGSSNSATVKTQIEAGTTTNAGHTSVTGTLTPVFVRQTSNDTLIVNFGQDSSFVGNETAAGNTDSNGIGDFAYAPPSGYLALCTSNLPEPTIGANSDTQADDYFNTVLYTGDGNSDHSITGVGFQPDWIWFKKRSGVQSHSLFDSTRGTDLRLQSDTTSADASTTTQLESFDSDGFTVNTNANVNGSGATYVAWNWKANGGTTSSNTDGSITSTVQANTDAGFSIGTFTKGSDVETVGHGLSVAPDLLIVKRRNGTGSWAVYHSANTANPETDYVRLNLTNATADDATFWGDTAPTTSVFSVGAAFNSGETLVCYAFHSVEGYSKFGSYIGNGNADGPFVFTGFRPAYVMIKRTDAVSAWDIFDATRNTFNVVNNNIQANANAAEASYTDLLLDFLSNGIKIRQLGVNASGGTYIYMAFAEAPFKYANAR